MPCRVGQSVSGRGNGVRKDHFRGGRQSGISGRGSGECGVDRNHISLWIARCDDRSAEQWHKTGGRRQRTMLAGILPLLLLCSSALNKVMRGSLGRRRRRRRARAQKALAATAPSPPTSLPVAAAAAG